MKVNVANHCERGYVATGDCLLSLRDAWPMAVLTPDGAGRGVACYLRKDPANGTFMAIALLGLQKD